MSNQISFILIYTVVVLVVAWSKTRWPWIKFDPRWRIQLY